MTFFLFRIHCTLRMHGHEPWTLLDAGHFCIDIHTRIRVDPSFFSHRRAGRRSLTILPHTLSASNSYWTRYAFHLRNYVGCLRIRTLLSRTIICTLIIMKCYIASGGLTSRTFTCWKDLEHCMGKPTKAEMNLVGSVKTQCQVKCELINHPILYSVTLRPVPVGTT